MRWRANPLFFFGVSYVQCLEECSSISGAEEFWYSFDFWYRRVNVHVFLVQKSFDTVLISGTEE